MTKCEFECTCGDICTTPYDNVRKVEDGLYFCNYHREIFNLKKAK